MSGVKKVFKKVTKKVSKVLVKGDLVHQVLKGSGLPDPVNDLVYGDAKVLSPAEAMQKLQKQQMDQQMQAEQDALNQQRLFDEQAKRIAANAAGLDNANAMDNTAKFEIGGSADTAPDSLLNSMRKRKRTTSASSQLGIV